MQLEAPVSLTARLQFIKALPCFAAFTEAQAAELASLMHEVYFQPNQPIVIEEAMVDTVFIIVQGKAEVVRDIVKHRRHYPTPIALLSEGETIGLNEVGFFSSTGYRTASVIALTELQCLRLAVQDLYDFLQRHHLETALRHASLQMLKMQLIKQSLPFTTLSPARLQWLAQQVSVEEVPRDTVIFNQGEQGDRCYLIHQGQIEILTHDEQGTLKRVALLNPPALFGETTFTTRAVRNATARTTIDTTLLTIPYEKLTELVSSESDVADEFMNLMINRSRPLQNSSISIHSLKTASGEEITILKNNVDKSYFRLSAEGLFVWEQLDGKHTLQEITLQLADKFNVFVPDVVASLIGKLARAKFIANIEINEDAKHASFFHRCLQKMRYFAEIRFAFGNVDAWITRWYQKWVRYLFTPIGQFALAFIAFCGFFAFVLNTADVLLFFSFKHASLLLLLGLLPLSIAEVVLHELGHAFTVKAFGREVNYFGVGWYWVGPIAFTDTSDMWLATRRPRMWVNLAGVYVDALTAGIAALGMFLTDNPYIQCMLWLFALYTYLGAFRMLNPLQELDGYYALMDWVEKNRLRQEAIRWLIKDFPKTLRHPSLFRNHRAEVIYWLACLGFIMLLGIITLIVQEFIFSIFGIQLSNPYMALAIPILVAVLSMLGIIADIRSAEKKS